MVNARFIADYTQFEEATRKAVVTLKTFGAEPAKVERELSRMTNSFSGQKLIEQATLMAEAIERVGGKSRLTESELLTVGNRAAEAAEKMRKMGIDVPPKLDDLAKAAQKPASAFKDMLGVIGKIGPALGVSLSIGTVTAFAKGVGEFAGKMVDLNAQTQISTSRLQAFNFAGAGAGLTIEDIVGSADQLAKRLGGDDDSVTAALGKLNLSARDLKSLSLDEVIFKVDEKLTGVGNQFDRARILADLFGRSGAQLGRLLDGSLREGIEAIEKTGSVIDEDLIKKADAFDDAWAQSWITFRALAVEAIGGVATAIANLRPPGWLMPGAFGAPPAPESRSPRRIGAAPSSKGPLQIDTSGLGPALEINQFGQVSTQSFGDFVGISIKDVIEESAIEKKLREWAEKTAEAAEETQAWVRQMHNQRGELLMKQDAALLNAPTSEATQKLQALAMRAGINGILPSGRIDVPGMFGRPSDISDRAQGLPSPGLLGIGQSLFGKQGAFAALPQTILGAIQGGGNVAGSIGSLFGSSLLGEKTGLNKLLTGGLTKALGSTIGGALGSVLPGIGALVGPAISGITKLFGGLFGAEGKKTNRARDSKIDEFTGITGDKSASQAKFRELATAAGVANAELEKLFSTKRTKDFESSMDSISQRIKTFTGDQAADQERLTAAIEKYGFTLEQLGPTLQKQKLDDQARELIEDWRVLIGAGIEITDVNNGMSDAINEYLRTAVKLGQEVPNAMRPILQKMLEQGTLTNDAGEAITDLEDAGIRFSESMTQGFDRVVEKLNELIEKIGLANIELGNMPAPPSVPDSIWNWNGERPSETPGFATGTSGRYLDFGAGTPVTLHGRERVMTEAEGQAQAQSSAAVVDAIHRLDSRMQAIMATMPFALRDAVLLAR